MKLLLAPFLLATCAMATQPTGDDGCVMVPGDPTYATLECDGASSWYPAGAAHNMGECWIKLNNLRNQDSWEKVYGEGKQWTLAECVAQVKADFPAASAIGVSKHMVTGVNPDTGDELLTGSCLAYNGFSYGYEQECSAEGKCGSGTQVPDTACTSGADCVGAGEKMGGDDSRYHCAPVKVLPAEKYVLVTGRILISRVCCRRL